MIKSIYQIRASKLAEQRKEFATTREMAGKLEITEQRLGALLRGPQAKQIGFNAARDFEQKLGLEENSLDYDPVAMEEDYLILIKMIKKLGLDTKKVISIIESTKALLK